MSRRNRRVRLEMSRVVAEPPPGVILWSGGGNDDVVDFDDFEAVIIGPDNSPYAGGMFNVSLHIPEKYPFVPPRVLFTSPIYHPNIDDKGRICLNILKQSSQTGEGIWKPANSIVMTLQMIRLLLESPNPDDPLMPDIADEYRSNRQLYNLKARECALLSRQTKTITTTVPTDVGSDVDANRTAEKRGVEAEVKGQPSNKLRCLSNNRN